MSIRVFSGIGGAKLNELVQVGRVEAQGSIMAMVQNLSSAGNAVVAFFKEVTGTQVHPATDTPVASEDTGYDGDTSEDTFTGQSLNNVPIVPGTVVVTPATTGGILHDGGDGFMYNATGVESGTVNYFTGALNLHYATADIPNGQLNAAYKYQDDVLVHGGRKVFSFNNNSPDDALVIKAAADTKTGAEIKTESAATWM
jgi:hypothetical protein